ncbi:DUF2194 domain-containing protein [Ectobacillus sp. sgz5001026]|uniref:DUF2194 domain-containing protein n=1 Tax=Ectobacillus sp. sgz5001026 TaxID=3242473 RepID=UPI0036D263AD
MNKSTNVVMLIAGGLLCVFVLLITLYRSDALYRTISVHKPSSSGLQLLDSKTPPQGQSTNLVLVETNDHLGDLVSSNIKKAMDYAHVHYKTISAEEIKNLQPSPYTGLILAGETPSDLPKDDIQKFVEGGGRLIMANRMDTDPSWYPMLGIIDSHGFTEVTGFTFKKKLFPGYPDISDTSELFTHSSIDYFIDPETTTTWATASKTPILWTHPFGNGKVLYWNTSALNDKLGRGLFVQSLGTVFPAFTSAQLGAQMMYIDDFPAPIPDGELPKNIVKESISTTAFYKDNWWKNMKSLSDEFGVKFTGVAIETYEDNVKPPLTSFVDADKNTYLLFGRELLAKGGEIGLHGYNHQPLVVAGEPEDPELGYKPWDNKQNMQTSITQLQKLVHNYFPNETLQTYVPPSNTLNKTGVDALFAAAPNLKTISSLYIGDEKKGGYIQEFGPDADHPGLYNFPRITSGYEITPEDYFTLADVAANFGIVSHFIHPDDVLDTDRSHGLPWTELFSSYRQMVQNVHNWYPQIQPMKQSEATEALTAYQKGDVLVTYEDAAIHLAYKGMPATSSVVIRLEDGKKLDTGTFPFGSVTKLQDQLYSVKLSKPEATLVVKGA